MTMQSDFTKCPVCGSTEGYEQSGIVGKYNKCNTCMAKWKLSIENQQLAALIMHELPKNGFALYKVTATNAPLYAELGKPLGLAFWKNLNLDGKIHWEYLCKTVDPTVLSCVIKGNNEAILYSWTGNRTV